MQTMLCQVTAIEALTAAVYRVQLQPPQAMKFKAGQYLQVVMGSGINGRSRSPRAPQMAVC